MADFCKQCSEHMFGEDFRELAGLCVNLTEEGWEPVEALCEGCGPTLVDQDGQCLSHTCLKQHGPKPK